MNNQEPKARVLNEDGILDVHTIWRTIQGEGPHAGRRAVFVRLNGCNLQCPQCDTDYTSYRHVLHPNDISKFIESLAAPKVRNLVVITGGEPFRQNIHPLISNLLTDGYDVQIETNGTLHVQIPSTLSRMDIVCSPKTEKIATKLRPLITAYKYVLSANHVDPVDGLPAHVLGNTTRPARPGNGFPLHKVYVQPLDEGNETANMANLQACVKSCLTYGYTLGVQLHKLIGVA